MNNIDVDYAEDLYIVMPMYNLLEFNHNYAKTSASLCQHCRDEPFNNITNSELFKVKSGLPNNTDNDGTVNVEIPVLLKYLSNFWRTLKNP